ncbi:MAG TPA: capsular biosynthesis protein [Cyanobacteria bacterium UBA8553]|nr:capsular biosynthesis protein [Cyanobacteria bacterium UBA8553]
MLNVTSSTADATAGNFKLGALSFPERVIYWTIVLTPLWWLSGLQTLLYPAIAVFLLVVTFDLDKIIRKPLPVCVWAWLAMSLVMLWTATIGLSNVGFGFQKTAGAGVTLLKSYFLIFTCLTLPFWSQIRVRVVTRAVAWMSTGYLVTIAVELAMLFLKIGKSGFMPPLTRLIPGDKLSLKVTFAEFQPFFGIPFPRTVLYTPDPPIVGVCTILCLFICLGETDRRLRNFALTGCLVGLLLSFSRSAWMCLPLSLLIMTCFRSRWVRQSSLWGASFTSLLCALLGLTFSQLINRFQEFFTSARAESSKDRELVVRKTIEAWQESPWLGGGIIQGSVKWYTYDIALGSFSTYTSVLYLHGIVGFIVFVTALASTLWSFWQPAVQGNPLGKRALASLVALYVMCNATPLTWMTVYFWFFFVWLGAILCEIQPPQGVITSWDQLSGGSGNPNDY